MTHLIAFWAVFLSLFFLPLNAEKVLVITSAYNRPDFVEIQHKTFKKFLQDDHEFVVFNDAQERPLYQEIHATCNRLGVRCIDIPQFIHNQPYLERYRGESFHAPAVRNANVVQYALNNLGFAHQGIVAIIDSDMFLVKPFSIKEFLKDHALAGVPQLRVKRKIEIPYLWIGIAFLDMEKLPDKESINFNCGKIQGVHVDAGGYTYHYLKQHPEVKISYFSGLHIPNTSCAACRQIREHYPCTHNREACRSFGLDDEQIDYLHTGLENVEFYLGGVFFHYRSGSNWDQKSRKFHMEKTELFNNYIEAILNN